MITLEVEGERGCGGVRSTLENQLLENLQPVARVGREERAAEHQDAAQNIFLGHLERGDLGLSKS